MNGTSPRFSIVIATDARARSLAETLASLRYLDGPDFEVVVVRGPTEDGIADVLASFQGAIKVAKNEQRNIAISRNLGIALAAGEVVAFIDDDAIPEREWLEDLAKPYADAAVGGVGGFVYNPDGVTFQVRFATMNRFGEANPKWHRPAPELCFPLSSNFPHLLGTNASFRRAALLEIGGFDTEFTYYLDETDLCCRLVDAGWTIRQLDRAFVHHLYRPSPIRDQHAVIREWYPILKNKLYFSLRNGRAHQGTDAIVRNASALVKGLREDLDRAVGEGHLPASARARFEGEIARAWEDGIRRGFLGPRRLSSALGEAPPAFLPFPRPIPPGGRRTVVTIGEGAEERARTLAEAGHHVHCVVRSEDAPNVVFENGVWRHRVPGDRAALFGEVEKIATKHGIDQLCAGDASAEECAYLTARGFPLVGELA